MSSTMEKSPSRLNRAFTAIDPELVETLNDIAAKATVLNGGYAITQRQVHDTLLWRVIHELGEEGSARVTYEAVMDDLALD